MPCQEMDEDPETPAMNKDALAALAVKYCDGVLVGEQRRIFEQPGFSFVCCSDDTQLPPVVRTVFQEATVEADAESLVVFERVVRGPSGSPIVLNIVTIS